MPEKVYWDSCAWLGLINSEAGKIPPLEYYFGLAKRGQVEIFTSAIAYVEVYHINTEAKPYADNKDALDVIKDIMQAPFVSTIAMDREVGTKARGLRRSHPELRLADAIHIASALVKNIPLLHTWDHDDIIPFDNQDSCKDATKLRIVVPDIPPAPPGTLFAATP